MVKGKNINAGETTVSKVGVTPLPAWGVAQYKARIATRLDLFPDASIKHKKKVDVKAVVKKGKLSDLKKKISYKNLSYAVTSNLIKCNPNSDILKSYRSSLKNCQSELIVEGKRVKSKYCNSRFCISCNRIRTGKLINNYQPVIDAIKDTMQFVTLTIPNVPADQLRDAIKGMTRAFQRIKDSLRKKGVKIVGLRKLECTYSNKRGDYHPHFHILIQDESQAVLLKNEWLKQYPEASESAQDIRKADVKSVKELFKYFTKLWGSNKETKGKANYRALDTIFTAMYGLRVFQPYGLKHLNIEVDESEDIDHIQVTEYNITPSEVEVIYFYEPDLNNYVNPDTGEILIDAKATKKVKKFYLEKVHIDTDAIPIYYT